MYFPNHKKVVINGQVLHWIMKFDGRDDLEIPIQIQIVTKKFQRFLAISFGEKTNLPEEIEIESALRPIIIHHGKQYWIKNDSVMLDARGELYNLFNVEEVAESGAILYFHSYLPEEFGGGVIIYDSRQYLESTSPNDVV